MKVHGLGFTCTLLHGWCKYHMTSLPSLKNEVCVKGPEKKACHNTDTTTTFSIYSITTDLPHIYHNVNIDVWKPRDSFNERIDSHYNTADFNGLLN